MAEPLIVGAILAGALALFLWGPWRHDVVAFLALVVAVILGVVPVDEAFLGFGHPAVVTVALVLVASQGLQASGLIDLMAKRVALLSRSPSANLVLLTTLGAVMSAFMNNVGALALLMPLAMQTSREPARVLMPLSFGTILGGMVTEIGTPPNIIIASYREEALGADFTLFDFTPVGGVMALAGVVFLVMLGWRLLPGQRKSTKSPDVLLRDVPYITEARVTEDSASLGRSVRQLERSVDNEALVVGLIRKERRLLGTLRHETLRAGDILILRAEEGALHQLVESADLELVGGVEIGADILRSDDVILLEAVLKPGGRLVNRTSREVGLHQRHGVNLLAIARHAERIDQPIGHTRLRPGDVLLVQGEADTLRDTMIGMGCLPLAGRGLRPLRKRRRILPGLMFAGALAAVAFGLLSIQIALAIVVVAMVTTGVIRVSEVYESIDWGVIVLLAALIPIGHALETSGATATIAHAMTMMAGHAPPWAMLGALMAITMVLTNLMNNAATAVVMAPLAFALAQDIGVSADPFLMAVAIGASSAFVTPIGHQNNVMVMSAGGYRFGDYWRMGLPLQVLMLVLGVPVITLVWPF